MQRETNLSILETWGSPREKMTTNKDVELPTQHDWAYFKPFYDLPQGEEMHTFLHLIPTAVFPGV